MDTSQLYDLRRRIHDWRNYSPEVVFSILDSIAKEATDKHSILESKIQKTLKAFAEQKLRQDENTMFPIQKYKKCIDKAHLVCLQILKVLNSSEPKQKSQQKGRVKSSYLFQSFKEQYSGYVERVPYLNAIADIILNNQWHQEIQSQLTEEKIKKVVIGIEKEIYEKNVQNGNTAALSYKMDMKSLCKFISNDKTGELTIRLFNGQLTFHQAAQLKSEDWISSEKKKEVQKIQQDALEAQQIGYYDQVMENVYQGVEGQTCKKCRQKTVYLQGELQTRRSDEPTTKFYKCIKCFDVFRTG
ncbi:hypothetical protein pb186bvf_007903 [Paramecium bursaria]